jgi:hypothetical protein
MKKKEEPSEPRSRPDWVARSLALLSAAVSIATLVHTVGKDRVTLQQDIEPSLECHIAPVKGSNGNFSFALRNTSPISLSAITVDFHPSFYLDSPLRGIGCGAPVSELSDVPGLYWWTLKEMSAGETEEKPLNPISKSGGTAALFEVSYYRPGDMKRFNEQCLFFVTPGSVKTAAEMASRPGYAQLLTDIQQCVAAKRQQQQIHQNGPVIKPS